MDRHAELLKLKAEALDRVEQILAHAKSEGRDEDHLTDEELTFVIGHECGHIQNQHVVST